MKNKDGGQWINTQLSTLCWDDFFILVQFSVAITLHIRSLFVCLSFIVHLLFVHLSFVHLSLFIHPVCIVCSPTGHQPPKTVCLIKWRTDQPASWPTVWAANNWLTSRPTDQPNQTIDWWLASRSRTMRDDDGEG